MIISASRRTDIPTYYSDWFFNRLQAGFVLVRNPMNPNQISRIRLDPDVVDGIVFWTKNPTPMLDKLGQIAPYMYYFQFSITAYEQDVECHVPDKETVIIPAFQRLAEQIGPDRVIWRYDPIFLNNKYTPAYHLQRFERFAKLLAPYTHQCIFSFLDSYRKTERNMASTAVWPFPLEEQDKMARSLAEIGHSHSLSLATCAEAIDLEQYGIAHAHCIDGALFEKLLGCPLTSTSKDKNQRPECGCMESLDIGAYNTCRNGCRYCYANFNDSTVSLNAEHHNPESPLLVGEVSPGEEARIHDRKMESLLNRQISFHL